jgi:sirohydrochlorin ferrochelatase
MSQNDAWSPGEPLGTEAFEQGDEALDEGSLIDSSLVETVEQDSSLDSALQVDERELEEAGAELDDLEDLVTLAGDMDDPDGRGDPTRRTRSRREDEGGWDLDTLATTGTEPDADSTD